jgi:hypothetical protein
MMIVTFLQRIDIVNASLQRRFSFLAMRRGFAAGVAGREEDGLDQVEVALGLHAVHQDRADHAAPANQTYQLAHFNALSSE